MSTNNGLWSSHPAQAELGARVGVTRQTIIAIEAAKYSPSLELAFRIARAFDKRLDDVFSFQPG
ncbi:MAG: helix-turn-helix transcriptional regulator [Alphaproteobacteria bacterium]